MSSGSVEGEHFAAESPSTSATRRSWCTRIGTIQSSCLRYGGATPCWQRTTNYIQPRAVEALGPFNASRIDFLSKLGRKLSTQSCDDSFLFQRLSVLIQRLNTILLHDSFVKEEYGPFQLACFFLCVAQFYLLWEWSTRVEKITIKRRMLAEW